MVFKAFKKIKLIAFLALAICSLCSNSIYAQVSSNGYIISKQFMGVEDGIAAREVFCGLQDDKGFLWFGTRNGLNRYDGKAFKLFTRRSHKMQENNIVKLASDMNNQLFILYGYSGYSRLAIGKVDVMDLQTLGIKSLTETFKNLPFKESKVYWIANDGTDRVNIMTYNPYQLWQYTAKDGFKLRYEMKTWDTSFYHYSVPTGPFNYFNKQYACIGIGGHEVQYVLKDNVAEPFPETPGKKLRLANFNSNKKEFLLLHSDYDNNKPGIYTINDSGKLVAPKTKDYHLSEMLKDGVLVTPVADDTTCIFNLPGKGVFFYNNISLTQVLEPSEIKDYANLSIYESFADKLGNIWVCGSTGIYKIKVKKNKFVHFFTKEQQKIEKNNQVRGILVDKDGYIYANVWDHLFIQQKDKQIAIKSNDVKYALIKHRGKIYVTSYDLQEYFPKEEQLKVVAGANTGRDILSATSFNDSIILMGKMEQVYTFNTNTNKIKLISDKAMGINLPYRFLKRKDGTSWVIGESGLLLLNAKAEVIDFFSPSCKELNHKLPVDNFTDIFEDVEGTIWLTSNGDGLYKWKMKENSFKHFGIEEGLPSNILYRVEEDNKHNLWISTENGLLLFNTQTESSNAFFVKDGLSHNEFNRLSSHKTEDGRLFFGGLNGVNAFYPEDIINDTSYTATPLRVISFQQYVAKEDKLIDLTASFLQQSQVVLKPGDRFFNLEFRLLDYENRLNRYAYKIDGQDKDWNYTTESSIRISGLPYGKYTLHVKGQTITGQWSSSQLVISIEVQAPFYTKIWFQLLMLMIAVAGIVLFFRYRTSRLKKDKLQLEETVTNRTVQLQKTLGERELLLKEIHHRVKNNLQIISGLLDLQKEEIESEESKAIFSEGQSRVKSIALIHQNLYQNDNLANIKFNAFVKDLAVQVGEVFEKSDAEMKINIDMPDIMLDIDTAVPIGLIINELLTNAFKYVIAKNRVGEVTISLQDNGKGNYTLVFADNGPGIPKGVDFETASSLGLRLIRGLAAQLYGTAVYHYSSGSVFTVNFKNSSTRKAEG